MLVEDLKVRGSLDDIFNIEGRETIWFSLEEWRKQWEERYTYIPELVKVLPQGFDISKIVTK